MPEDSLDICDLSSVFEDLYCGGMPEGVGGKLLSVQTYLPESLLADPGDCPGSESLSSVPPGVGDKERISGFHSFPAVQILPDREPGLIREDYKGVFLRVSLTPHQEDSFLSLESDISDICPDCLYSSESGTEEEIHYSKVPEGFLPVVLQEVSDLVLCEVLFLKGLFPPGSLDTLCDIGVDLKSLRPLIEFADYHKVGGDSQGGETGLQEGVLVLQDILPVEVLYLLSGLFDPEEKLGESPGVEISGGVPYILGGNKHTYYLPPVGDPGSPGKGAGAGTESRDRDNLSGDFEGLSVVLC